jgi:hypothetical protein
MSRQRGRLIETATYVFDLNNLSLSPNAVALAIFKATIKIDQAYYPERLHQAFFINSPWIFQGIWAVIAPFMHPVTRAKARRCKALCAPSPAHTRAVHPHLASASASSDCAMCASW